MARRAKPAWTPGPLLVLALVLAGCGPSAPPARRNLLFVTIDTLRADHLSCYGYGRPTSPHLDELAARSQRFESLWSVMPTTLPAHAALFTSLYPAQFGAQANGQVVSPQAHTLAERLAEHGFATGAFVSATPLDPRFGLDQGFATYDFPETEERPGDRTREQAVAWLRQRGPEPFFCFVHLFDPHTWYAAPEAHRKLFDAPDERQPPERGLLPEPEEFDATMRREQINAYDAEIHFADEQLGLLLAELKTLGFEDSTVVVVTSDHGETLDGLIERYGYGYDHGEFLHRRELRVPLVIHVPGADKASGPGVQGATVTSLDVLPTVLELLDVPRAGLLLGRSLVPLLEGQRLPPRPAFAESRQLTRSEREQPLRSFLLGHESAVATEDWLFVDCETRPVELYDLRTDPKALHNVAESRPAEREHLEDLLEAYHEAQNEVERLGDGSDGAPIDPALLQALRSLGYAADE